MCICTNSPHQWWWQRLMQKWRSRKSGRLTSLHFTSSCGHQCAPFAVAFFFTLLYRSSKCIVDTILHLAYKCKWMPSSSSSQPNVHCIYYVRTFNNNTQTRTIIIIANADMRMCVCIYIYTQHMPTSQHIHTHTHTNS